MAVERKEIEQALAESLKHLVLQVPFEKITIRQITDGAGVIRVTFYNHFQDKYDLLGWIIRREILEPARILIRNDMYREAIVLIFRNLLRDKAFYTRASRLEGQNSFEEISEECIYELLQQLFEERAQSKEHPRYRWFTTDNLAKYYARSMNFIVQYWIRSGMTVPPEEIAMIYEEIGTHSMWDMLQEL